MEKIPSFGIWADTKVDYLKEEDPDFLEQLYLTDQLFNYLSNLQENYSRRFERMIEEREEKEGVTEELKAQDVGAWIQKAMRIQSEVRDELFRELNSNSY